MKFPNFSLEGKVALVTGGSRGIGRAIALTFADAGANVAVSARKLPGLEEVAEEIKTAGGKCLPVACHIAKLEESKNLVERVKAEFGRIDILVNNAGANPVQSPVLDTEEWAWDVIMNVNLKGVFFLSQLVARIMKEQGGGRIINIASYDGIRPQARHMTGVYSVSKAAIISLTKVMAQEWGQYNIRVNAIAPGVIKTRFSEVMWKDPAVAEKGAKEIPLGCLGEPRDIAGAALYLASDASSYVTGATLVVSGGELG